MAPVRMRGGADSPRSTTPGPGTARLDSGPRSITSRFRAEPAEQLIPMPRSTVSAASISTGAGGELFAGIGNTAGNIGSNASINLDISGNISTAGPLKSALINNDGGHIGGTPHSTFSPSGAVKRYRRAVFPTFHPTSNSPGSPLARQ